jgi:hypothetical protein
MRMARLTALTALLLGMGGLPARAESSNAEVTKGMQELGVWGGEGLVATTAFGGLTRPEAAGRMSAVLGLRYGRVLLVKDSLTLSYIGDLVPIEIQRGNVTRESDSFTPTARATVFGTGLAPLGLKASFGRARLKPFVSAAGGVLVFGQRVPLPAATKLTFTGDISLGAELWTRASRAFTLGLKFHHISNAGTGDVNRGLNLFVLYGGLSFFR